MSTSERRKIFSSVLFHLLAIVCMMLPVYVLAKRTAEEIRLGKNGQYIPADTFFFNYCFLFKLHLLFMQLCMLLPSSDIQET